MTPVAISFVIPRCKKAQAYFFVFFYCFETSKQTIMTSVVIWRLKGLPIIGLA